MSLEILHSPVIEGFSPSMKLVLSILENRGPMTQKEIAKETRLPSRTVRYALSRLKDNDILEECEYFQDARQRLYKINANCNKRGKEVKFK